MNTRMTLGRRASLAVVAVAAAAFIASGAAWHGVVAGAQQPAPRVAQTTTQPARSLAGGRDSYADIVNIVGPAVVTIHAEGKARALPTEFQMPNDDLLRRFFGEQSERQGRQPRMPRQQAMGSGVIVTTDGYLLTNNHVVDGAENIRVELTDGRTLPAKVVGTDKPSDLAVLKINASDLHTVTIGNSNNVQVGDVVLAVGNPLGVGQTVTMGIISAKGRSTGAGNGGYEDFLQTDAPINHGNSGGALVNTKGELVGINSQILSNSDGNIGIGFAIPSNMAKTVMEELKTTGHVTRAQLGVSVQTVTSDLAASMGLKEVGGALVSGVAPGSAAERAGIKRGDVIRAFNGEAVHDTNTLRNRVAAAGVGKTADVLILRDGSEKHLSVKLDEATAEKSARNRDAESDSADKTALGVSVAPLTPELAARVGAPKDAHGVVVEDVNPDGRAAEAGIQEGDIIQEANRQPVHTAEDLRAAVHKMTDRPLLLLITRQGHDLFMTVKPANG